MPCARHLFPCPTRPPGTQSSRPAPGSGPRSGLPDPKPRLIPPPPSASRLGRELEKKIHILPTGVSKIFRDDCPMSTKFLRSIPGFATLTSNQILASMHQNVSCFKSTSLVTQRMICSQKETPLTEFIYLLLSPILIRETRSFQRGAGEDAVKCRECGPWGLMPSAMRLGTATSSSATGDPALVPGT